MNVGGTVGKEGIVLNIWIIWAIDPSTENPWIVGAVDAFTIEEDSDIWFELLDKAEREHGARFIRVTKSTIDYAAVQDAFMPAVAELGPVEVVDGPAADELDDIEIGVFDPNDD